MKRSEIIFLVLLGVTVIAFLTYQALVGNDRRTEFIESQFANEVFSVDYVNKIDRISFADGSELSFSLNYSRISMRKFHGKRFSTFIFPGDSMLKKPGDDSILIKPMKGEPFRLFF